MKWMQALSERQGRRSYAWPGRSLFCGGLLLLGVFIGVQIYCHAKGAQAAGLKQLLALETIAPTWRAVVGGMWQALVLPLILLVTAYITGLSPCGAIVGVLLPLLYGMGVGATEAHLYALGLKGVVVTLLLVVPRVWLMWIALQVACGECIRMSRLFVAQLRPAGAHCGGLQMEFRVYCIRFSAVALLAFAAALCKISSASV